MPYSNTRVKLASRPVGLPRPENLAIDTVEIAAFIATLPAGSPERADR